MAGLRGGAPTGADALVGERTWHVARRVLGGAARGERVAVTDVAEVTRREKGTRGADTAPRSD